MKIGIVKKAMEELELSDHYLYKVAAVIFKGSRIFGSGHNSFRSSNIPLKYKKWPHTLHAEQAAIYSINDWSEIKGSSILVIRANKSGNLSKGYPCKHCLNTIKYVGIKNIYYSNRQGEIVRERVWI